MPAGRCATLKTGQWKWFEFHGRVERRLAHQSETEPQLLQDQPVRLLIPQH
jgi:hypothetical protein